MILDLSIEETYRVTEAAAVDKPPGERLFALRSGLQQENCKV
jgi:hypothetical protein